jgi:hypothetical protein
MEENLKKMILALELEVKELAKKILNTETSITPKNKMVGILGSKLTKMLDVNAVDISLQPLVNMVNTMNIAQTANIEQAKHNSEVIATLELTIMKMKAERQLVGGTPALMDDLQKMHRGLEQDHARLIHI